MKIFQKFEEIFTFVAVRVKQPKTPPGTTSKDIIQEQIQIQPFGFKQFAMCLSFTLSLVLSSCPLYFDNRSFEENVDSIYSIVTSTLNLYTYLTLFFDAVKLFEMIENFESAIKRRKLN